jgi:hypothetical protein
MPRAELKRPVGIPDSTYNEIEQYAKDHQLFIFEVVVNAWNEFKKRIKKVKNN